MSIESQIEKLKKEFEQEVGKAKKIQDMQLDTSDIITFIEKYIAHPKGLPQDKWFEKRDYLLPLYRDTSKRILIVKGRQMEITEYAVNMLIYWALKRRGTYIYASSTLEKVRRFSKDRLTKQLTRSPALKPFVYEKDVHRIRLGESVIYLYTAGSQNDTLRGIAADMLILDEFQDMPANSLAIAEETLAHSDFKRLIIIGTPKEAGTLFEKMWAQDSDKKEWIGNRWVATNTNNILYSGYHISQLMAVGQWLTEKDIEEKKIRYPKQKFVNEVLGEFYAGLGKQISYQTLLSLFDPTLPCGRFNWRNDLLFAGVDWGVGRRAASVFWLLRPVFIQPPNDWKFDTIYIEKIEYSSPQEHINRVLQLMQQFPVKQVACDIGAGMIQNEALFKAYPSKVMNVHFISRPEKPMEIVPTPFGPELKLDRTWAIDYAYETIAKGKMRLYNELDEGMRNWIIENFLAEYPETNDKGVKQWKHDPETSDDALMAYIYALMAFYNYEDTTKYEDPNTIIWV